jgi:BirA family biotin operon repressor/biotin-[acetyl-CoA-carboxylase] ligase
MTAVALADTISKWLPDEVRIKWPNDVLIGGKKTAGILTELSADRNKIHHVIIGVGINVNHGIGSFPRELRQIATSVRRALKRKVNRIELLQLFLKNLEKEYELYKKHRLKKAHTRLRSYSSLISHEITLRSGKHETTGIAKDIDAEGRLVLETSEGVRPVIAGEVTVVKK